MKIGIKIFLLAILFQFAFFSFVRAADFQKDAPKTCLCYNKITSTSPDGETIGKFPINTCDECDQVCANFSANTYAISPLDIRCSGGSVTKQKGTDVALAPNKKCACDNGTFSSAKDYFAQTTEACRKGCQDNSFTRYKFDSASDFANVAMCTKSSQCTDAAKPLCNVNTGICVSEADAAKLPTGQIYSNNQTTTPTTPQTSKQFNYTLLESFPGFFNRGDTLTDLPALILAIYKFGIWTVGIAGFFMLVVGGFMYMASAGNTSTASNARGIIWDALLGIAAALGAYLILYVINPELTNINIAFTTVNVTETDDFGGVPTADPITASTTSVGGCMKVVRAADAAKAAGWVYSGKTEGLRGKTVNGTRYTDCSDLVSSAYQSAGCVSPGDNTKTMYSKAVPFNSKTELKAGDAVVHVGHVILCMTDGCGTVIHAPGTGKPITIKSGDWATSKSGGWSDGKVIKASSFCKSC